MDTVASSALEARANSIAVRSARWDSGNSFNATAILENISDSKRTDSDLSYESNSSSRYHIFLVATARPLQNSAGEPGGNPFPSQQAIDRPPTEIQPGPMKNRGNHPDARVDQ